MLRARHRLLQAVRAFFVSRGFLEVTTPVRVAAPANEDYIDAAPAGDAFLRTSPELHMKRLLAAGCGPVFQLGPCFRHGERGRRHLPEFTMLEWYRPDAGYLDILADTIDLVRAVSRAVNGGLACEFAGSRIDLAEDWEILAVDDAFTRHADCALGDAVGAGTFEEVLVARVEPHLGVTRPTVLTDYPVSMAAVARRKPEDPTRAERWELYIGGLEIANAYGELTDHAEQARRFDETVQLRRSQNRPVYPMDNAYMRVLKKGLLPPSGGIALGIDRLLMVLTGAEQIDDVVSFPAG